MNRPDVGWSRITLPRVFSFQHDAGILFGLCEWGGHTCQHLPWCLPALRTQNKAGKEDSFWACLVRVRWYFKARVSFLVTTNLKTRENALDNWCHSVACCDRDFCMCSGQWVSLHCQILPSSYWRLLKFRDEEIKQEDHKYLYTNEHHQAFQVGFWAPVPGVKPCLPVLLRECLDPNTYGSKPLFLNLPASRHEWHL